MVPMSGLSIRELISSNYVGTRMWRIIEAVLSCVLLGLTTHGLVERRGGIREDSSLGHRKWEELGQGGRNG
jgi:hypothetical protein